MNSRVTLLRKELNMSQDVFGRRLGVRNTAISKIESGENNLTEQMAKLICSEFHVNEEWLRTGIGEMFVENDQTILSDLSKEYHLDQLDVKIVQGYLALNQEQRQAIKQFVVALAKEIGDEASPSPDLSKEDREEIDAEVESYRAQLLREMTSEKKLG